MNLEIRRRIRDNLYGSIDVSLLEGEVISHPMFQRLRRVKQTAFLNLIFPGASHSRFEHSLGVMHLAGLAWSKIKDNQERLKSLCSRYRQFSEREKERHTGEIIQGILHPTFSQMEKIFASAYSLQALRLAALLHDVGHPPFSHSGERFLPTWEDINTHNPHLPPFLKQYIQRQIQNNFGKERVHHELMSVLIVNQILSDLYYQNPNIHLKVSAQDIASIIIPDIEAQKEFKDSGALFLCRELLSGEVDIDRMDYLRRDAKECGVAYGHFDVDRILDSLAIYSDKDDSSIHLALQYSGLAALEDYLRSRQSMYVQLYFHKTSTACEAMMQKLASQIGVHSLPAEIKEYATIDEYEIRQFFSELAQNHLLKTQFSKFSALLKDLFVNRKLWKMVYEITEESNFRDFQNHELQAVTKLLKEESMEFEVVSSHNVLTKLKTQKSKKKQALRLIKMDSRQFPRVEAVEDYSVLSKEKGVLFHRVYVRQEDASEARMVIREMLDAKDLFGKSSG